MSGEDAARGRRSRRRRDDIWGDEPQEVDASRVVEEVEEDTPQLARRWYDHPAVVPLTVVARFIRRSGKRIGVTIVGFLVIIAGVAMLVLPGPGIVVIIAGLAILATEYVWAQRLLKIARERFDQAKDAVLRKKPPQEPEESAGS